MIHLLNVDFRRIVDCMKWFVIEFWHFVTTSNILGVAFGFFISYLWKRIGKVEVAYVKDKKLNVEGVGTVKKEGGKENFFVDIYNDKGIDLYITEIKLKRGCSEYNVLPEDDKENKGTLNEIINVKAKSVKRICLNSLNKEGGIKEDDVIKFKFNNKVSRFGLSRKNIKEIKI